MPSPEFGSYPEHLAGQPCPPPGTPPAHVLAMATEAARRAAPGLDDDDDLPVYGAGDWRMAASLVILADEANHHYPGRDRSSDGTIGDARHAALGSASDHNPWVRHKGIGVVRARDLDATGLPLARAFELARVKAFKNELPQLRHGGYLIYAGKITAGDFTGWRIYKGENPHILHGHVSVSTDPARFDDRRPWGIFDPAPAPAPRPAAKQATRKPAPATPKADKPSTRWLEQGPGHYPPGDPRHYATRALQTRLRTRFPAYARHLAVDGIYGPKTAAAVREFQRRKYLEVNGIAGPLTLSRLGL